MFDPQIEVGKLVKYEDEMWEIISIDFSSDKVQLIHKTARITAWIHFEKVNLMVIFHFKLFLN